HQIAIRTSLAQQRDEQLAQRTRFRNQNRHSGFEKQLDPHFESRVTQNGRRSAQESTDAGGWNILVGKVERSCMSHPAGEQRRRIVLMAARDEQKRRRARPAVQILVTTPDGKVGTCAVEIYFQSASAVTQIPENQRSASMR